MAGARERTAVLVVRVWLDAEDEAQPLRARITSTRDASVSGAMDTVGATSEKEIVKTLRSWLRTFIAGQ